MRHTGDCITDRLVVRMVEANGKTIVQGNEDRCASLRQVEPSDQRRSASKHAKDCRLVSPIALRSGPSASFS
jgi:hypothetical protein